MNDKTKNILKKFIREEVNKLNEVKKKYKIILTDKDLESLNIDENPDKIIEKILLQASNQGWDMNTYGR